jgi:hypothetical protein
MGAVLEVRERRVEVGEEEELETERKTTGGEEAVKVGRWSL